jgi:hypothetical protein
VQLDTGHSDLCDRYLRVPGVYKWVFEKFIREVELLKMQ